MAALAQLYKVMHPVKLNKVVVSNCSEVERVESKFPNEELGAKFIQNTGFSRYGIRL